ncbi:integral membrane protein [Streptomyces lincolnensis]|uniref:Integral membrane protein n=1 Tax=Streptomyces lincolnensis TaxID=1915 RepID=A0A1B1MD71_STRLN|nr:DUF3566 domain-containing protein [Streptomyces lincolnensis]ANS66504.1 integral membrane protein [Streptomyces lincolnensis]AXG55374.1 integral membrane protein [Streptomyces lincolnensis]QMV08113.1 hypothetical protein GJU35_22335 [Streptomyces lincolnensis]
MSGATGAGSTGTSTGPSTGPETDGGGRGSAAKTTDPHTTNLQAIKPPSTEVRSPDTHGSQGGTVTDTRGPQAKRPAGGADRASAPATPGGQPQPQPAAQPQPQPASQAAPKTTTSPLPGERQPEQPAGPYHPPQAYPAQAPSSAVRRPRTGARTTPRTRKARLRVSKADPWSVMKVSFLLSIALGICTIVAAAVLWMVMDAMGVFSTVGGTISEATGSNESNGFDLQSFLSLPNVLIFTSIIAVIDVILATALATLGAFIYNLSAGFVGGVELTLAEDE